MKRVRDKYFAGQDYVTIHCNSQNSIYLPNHQTYHERTKHVDIRLHFIRDVVEFIEVKIMDPPLEDNPIYVFTKLS